MINKFINALKNFLSTGEKTILIDRESAIKVVSEFEFLKKKYSDLVDTYNMTIDKYNSAVDKYSDALSSKEDYKARWGEKVKELYQSDSKNKELEDKVKRLEATVKLNHDRVMCNNLQRSIDLLDQLSEPEPRELKSFLA